MSALRRAARDLIWTIRRVGGQDTMAILAGRLLSERNRATSKVDTLADVEFGVFSQWGEDGIIDWLVSLTLPHNDVFVEFGVEDYRESNTRYLLQSRNWSGLVIDGDERNIATIRKDPVSYKFALDSVCSFVTAEGIGDILNSAQLPDRLGLLSVDMDGVDWWVLERIDRQADIIVVEYNDFFGEAPVTVPYTPDFVRAEAHWSNVYWGASLNAFRFLLERRGYVFAGTNSNGTNAFFLHGDHEEACCAAISRRVPHSCKLRDTRNQNGRLARLPYMRFLDEVRALPLVRVDTGETTTVSEAIS